MLSAPRVVAALTILVVLFSLVGDLLYPPMAAPVPGTAREDLLAETLVVVEDLLQRFEETAASHHVLLTGPPAAQRIAALRLVSLARVKVTEDREAAERYLGWAATFPGSWWYGIVLSREHFFIVVDAMEKVAQECRENCPQEALEATGFETPNGDRRPYIQPNQIAVNGSGGFDALLDFVHYPPERFEVSVRADALPVATGHIEPGATLLRVPASMGTYEVTAHLSRGDAVHRYRAPAITCNREGIAINGERRPLKLVRLEHPWDFEFTEAVRIIEGLVQQGFNAAIVSNPPGKLVAAAEKQQFGLAVELTTDATSCGYCPSEQIIAGVHATLAASVKRYVESPAVWLWVVDDKSAHADALIEMAAPAFRQFDPYERPLLFPHDTPLAAANDLSMLVLEEDLIDENLLARNKERSSRRDVAALLDVSRIPDPGRVWQQAEPLGYAGVILETINLETWTPPSP